MFNLISDLKIGIRHHTTSGDIAVPVLAVLSVINIVMQCHKPLCK